MRILSLGAAFALSMGQAASHLVVGQTASLGGTAIEKLSRVPVASATVRLITSTGDPLATSITDSRGRFRFDLPAPGQYRIRAERPGFLTVESSLLSVEAGVARTIELELTRRPVLLDSVLVRESSITTPLRPTEQLIQGRLLDDDTGEPIPGGTIELRDASSTSVTQAISDRNGSFRLVSPNPGTYSMRGERPGFQTAEQNDLILGLGDSLLIEFRLSRNAAILAPVLVTASAKPWMGAASRRALQELYDRMNRFGQRRYAQFILRDTIDAYDRRDYSTAELLARVVRSGSPTERERRCFGARYYVDGLPFEAFGSESEFWPLKLLETIEVYTHPTLPAEFASPIFAAALRSPAVPPCRVISMWTRRRSG